MNSGVLIDVLSKSGTRTSAHGCRRAAKGPLAARCERNGPSARETAESGSGEVSGGFLEGRIPGFRMGKVPPE